MCVKSGDLVESGILKCSKKKNGYWGYHLILDCQGCDIEKVTSRDNIKNFIETLVRSIDMKAYGEPILEHFATHDPTKGGYSLVQLIETSNITAHFVDMNGDAYIDIFSCKPFSSEIVKEVVDIFFRPTSIKMHFLTRQA
jgi:S-adenosylmethionine/arginine decarboxylase-like enzyme